MHDLPPSNRMLRVRFVPFDHRARCKVEDCKRHEKLYRLELNSVDYIYFCEEHAGRYINEAVLGLSEINPGLLNIRPDSEYFKAIVKKSVEYLRTFKTFSGRDLEQEIIKLIEGELT